MKTLSVAEFKSHFSEVLDEIRKGHEIILTFGRKKEKLAVMKPFKSLKTKRALGVLQGKMKYRLSDDFRMTDKEFLES